MPRRRVAVIGGGIAGMAAAYSLAKALEPGAVVLLERGGSLGGKIRTVHRDGWTIEEGPDSLLTTKSAGIELCDELGITDSLQPAIARNAFVVRNDRLHPLPSGLSGLAPASIGQIMGTSLLSLPGRMRAAMGALSRGRRKAEGRDETIELYATRRFGREAYRWVAEPVLAGIHAGNAARLSLSSTFPQLASAPKDVPRPKLTHGTSAFVAPGNGMRQLVLALEAALAREQLGVELLRNACAISVRRSGDGFRVVTDSHGEFTVNGVIIAAPAWATAPLVAEDFAELSSILDEIPFVSTATVSLGFSPGAVMHPLDGSGYVSPRARGGSVVACTWSSSKFAGRAPDGAALLRVFIGRAGLEDPTTQPDDVLIRAARSEVESTMGITASPAISHASRWPAGLAQYEVGHSDRMRRIDDLLGEMPGLAVAGHSYRGVGIPDCIESGRQAARRVLTHIEA